MRLLDAGAIVARTNNDLERYHGKYIIVDRKKLYLLAFNFTRADLHRTRSFGLATSDAAIVQEAVKLFTADCTRQPYISGNPALVVSPVNARHRLRAFIGEAKKELLIYDPEISDSEMWNVLRSRAEAGVAIRIIGGNRPRPRPNFLLGIPRLCAIGSAVAEDATTSRGRRTGADVSVMTSSNPVWSRTAIRRQ